MEYEFNNPVNREGTQSVKWDWRKKIFNTEDLIPLWVADMDFQTAPEILDALKERVEHGVFGYTFDDDDFYRSIVYWLEKRHSWKVDKSWIVPVPGLIPGINFSIQAFSSPGDGVIIQPPVYKPFFDSVKNNGRKLVTNPLSLKENSYFLDNEDLETKTSSGVKLLVLCNPHNPVGKVWEKKDLEILGEICGKNNVKIISDEIHFDIVYGKKKHVPLASISREISENTITLISPGKTFNIQGLQGGAAIISNKEDRDLFREQLMKNGIFINNLFTLTATRAAYFQGESWLNSLLEYLEDNRKFLISFIKNEIHGVDIIEPEGTYVAWLDFRQKISSIPDIREHLINKARVGLIDGKEYGAEGSGFQRINFATRREVLEEALIRIRDSFK